MLQGVTFGDAPQCSMRNLNRRSRVQRNYFDGWETKITE